MQKGLHISAHMNPSGKRLSGAGRAVLVAAFVAPVPIYKDTWATHKVPPPPPPKDLYLSMFGFTIIRDHQIVGSLVFKTPKKVPPISCEGRSKFVLLVPKEA